jgi:hypothetical protein
MPRFKVVLEVTSEDVRKVEAQSATRAGQLAIAQHVLAADESCGLAVPTVKSMEKLNEQDPGDEA